METDTELFKLRVNCTFHANAQGRFQDTVWPEISRVLQTHGAKTINTAFLEVNGKTIPLSTGAEALAGVH